MEEISKKSSKTFEELKKLNRKYGKSKFPYVPFIFVDKIADAKFIEKASELKYNLWGIDREYEFSYLIHLDELYSRVKNKTSEITKAYEKARKKIAKINFKLKVSGESKYCWMINEPMMKEFFSLIDSDQELARYIREMKNSWSIYCRFVRGKGGSNARARYMRRKFDSLYSEAKKVDEIPKVLVKLGGVHLTHGKSIFGRYDVGNHLHDKAKENKTGFLAIRHMWRYKNGSDQSKKKNYEGTRFLLSLGKKDQWTLIDLRPLKKLWMDKKIIVDKGTEWELKSYDLFLISPDDTKGKVNR